MKRIYITIVICTLLIIPIYSQKGVISYTATLTIDPNSNEYSKKQKEFLQKAMNSSRDVDYTLTINKEKALFVKVEKMKNDSDTSLNLTSLLAGDTFYSDIQKKENIQAIFVFGNNFLITRKSVKWHLLPETKKINGYNCKKATATIQFMRYGRKMPKKVTAWYCPDIPLNFGPKFYNGLPGLILKLQEGKLTFYATKIILNPKKNITIKKPFKGQLVTIETLSKIATELKENR